jgi:uncharacterized repeat protein (TIGR03803 family)
MKRRIVILVALCAGCAAPQQALDPQALNPQVATRPQRSSAGYEVLYSFTRTGGTHPLSDLLAYEGNLIGTAFEGEGSHDGTVYEVGLDGKERVLHRFAGGSDGRQPTASLTELNGTLYGTTYRGGTGSCNYGGCGIVFSISPSGKNYTIVHEFDGADGAYPSSDFVVFNGTLYGATPLGGANDDGTVFTVSPSGGFKTLYSFRPEPDGIAPSGRLAVLNGRLYGATVGGGAYDLGTVFSVTPGGEEQVVYSCRSDDCKQPVGGIALLRGKLYGTSWLGGVYGEGAVFSVTTGGKEHTVYSFGENDNGGYPFAPLTVQNGVLYGSTTQFRGFSDGALFSLTPAGSFQVLYNWRSCGKLACDPQAAVTYLNGNLYGTLSAGGAHHKGLLFSVTP